MWDTAPAKNNWKMVDLVNVAVKYRGKREVLVVGCPLLAPSSTTRTLFWLPLVAGSGGGGIVITDVSGIIFFACCCLNNVVLAQHATVR